MSKCFEKCANLWCFLVVFCLCYFLETITFTYLVSAVQSVEKQFQIPSTQSGLLIAASDIGYVLTVVVLAYMGSKGNRARWIGGGCVLISLACFLCSLPNFIFPNKESIYGPDFVNKILVPEYNENFTYNNSIRNDAFLLRQYKMFLKDLDVAKTTAHHFKDEEFTVHMKFPGHVFNTSIMLSSTRKMVTTATKKLSTSTTTTKLPSTSTTTTTKRPSTTTTTNVPASTSTTTTSILKTTRRREFDLIEGSGDGTMADMEDIDDEEITDFEDSHVLRLRRDIAQSKEIYWTKFLSFANSTITEEMAIKLKNSSILPFSFCNPTVIKIKRAMKKQQCKEQKTNNIAYGIVFVAISLIGVGHSMPWTLGMPLIDDNVKKENTPYFFAGVFFIRIMGPVLGFVLGGWANKLYVTLNPPKGLTPMDPAWIGAWWLGFLLIAIALFIPAVMLCCFPNIDLKDGGSNKKKNNKNRTTNEGDHKDAGGAMLPKHHFPEDKSYYDGNTLPVDELDPSFVTRQHKNVFSEIKFFFVSLGHCLMSPVYCGALVGRLFDAFAFKGFFAFQPKYLETHYGIPQYKVSLYMAVMGIVGFAGGVVLGSLIMRKCKLEKRRAAFYVGMCSLISAGLSFSEIFLGCTSVNNQVGQMGLPNNFTFTQPCNQACDCTGTSLFPVCDRNAKPYFNPCYAGCTNLELVSNDTANMKFNLTECGCSGNQDVSRDYCTDDCATPMKIYFGLSVISGVVGGSSVIPGILIVFRSVPADLRSVALGFSGFIVSLMSTFPSPIVVGNIIDTTCILWNKPCGEEQGSCQLYDPSALRVRIHMFHGILRTAALLFDVWVWYWAINLTLMEEKVKDNEEITEEVAGSVQQPHMPNIKRNRKKSAVAEFVEDFGSQYGINMAGVGGNCPSDLGPKLSI